MPYLHLSRRDRADQMEPKKSYYNLIIPPFAPARHKPPALPENPAVLWLHSVQSTRHCPQVCGPMSSCIINTVLGRVQYGARSEPVRFPGEQKRIDFDCVRHQRFPVPERHAVCISGLLGPSSNRLVTDLFHHLFFLCENIPLN